MLSGIGRIGRWPKFKVQSASWRINFQFSVISFLFFTLVMLFPSPTHAVTRIDFSEALDFFEDITVGDTMEGDLDKGFPNPYEGAGMVVGYKLMIPSDIDTSRLQLKVQSCAFRFAFLCLGTSNSFKIYVYNGKFETIGEEFTFKSEINMEKIKIPQDRTLYLLVGNDTASETGQFLISTNLKEVSN